MNENNLKLQWLILDEQEKFDTYLNLLRAKSKEAIRWNDRSRYHQYIAHAIKMKELHANCMKSLKNISEYCIDMLYEERCPKIAFIKLNK